jgi:nucleoside-diphosphate-sugar epimerase
MLGIDNLIGAIVACLDSPAAANRTYLLSDQEDLSTPELIGLIATAMGKRPRLLPFPVALLRAMGFVTGRAAELDRLVGSLALDSSPISAELGWRPTVPPAEGLAAMVKAFLASTPAGGG